MKVIVCFDFYGKFAPLVLDVGSWREGGGRGAMQQNLDTDESAAESSDQKTANQATEEEANHSSSAGGSTGPSDNHGGAAGGPHPHMPMGMAPRPGMPPMGPGGPMMFRGMMPPYVSSEEPFMQCFHVFSQHAPPPFFFLFFFFFFKSSICICRFDSC